jgi:hypothetical protein
MGKVKINYINEGVVYEADAGKKLSEINEEEDSHRLGFAAATANAGNAQPKSSTTAKRKRPVLSV